MEVPEHRTGWPKYRQRDKLKEIMQDKSLTEHQVWDALME